MRLSAARDSGGYLRKSHLYSLILLGGFWSLGFFAQAQTTDDSVPQSLATMTLHIGKAALTTEIAATPEQREKGLMFRPHLGDNSGMIFLMPSVGPATFWMKNTLIPLSVAFIDKEGVILEIHDMKALDESITRSDSDQVAYALETNLHWFALNGLKSGDKIEPAPDKWVKAVSR